MTTVTENQIGTGAPLYSLPQTWEDATPINITVSDQIWRGLLLNQEFVSAGTILTISGTTTDATRYVELTTAPGCSFADHANKATNAQRYNAANGAAMRVTGDGAACIRIQVPYTRISKIQFTQTSSNSGAYPAIFADSAGTNGGLILDQIIAEGYAQTAAVGGQITGVVNISGPGSSIRNSTVFQKSNAAAAVIVGAHGFAELHNCTLASLSATLNIGVMTAYGATTIKNTYIGGVTATDGGGNPSIVVNCATSAASWPTLAAGSANNLANIPLSTANFVNVTVGTHDLRKVAGSVLINAGTSDPTYAAVDAFGISRPQGVAYDIGADEFPAAPDTTAPNLLNQTAAANGATAYTGSVSTDEAGGTLYYLVLPAASAAPSQATITASGSTKIVSAIGAQPVSGSGLTQATAYRLHFMQKDTAGNPSTVVSSASFTTAATVATTPSLVSPTAAANGATSYTGSVSTDTNGGTLYYLPLPAAAATPDAATMVASGSSQSVSGSTGTQPVSGSGLTQATAYRLHFMQKNTAGNASTVVSSGSFTTAAVDTTAPTWTGANPAITPGTITSSSVAFSYPAATDTAPGVVAGYETSKNGVWQDNGTGLTGQYNVLPSDTDIVIGVRAYDNANPKNYSSTLTRTMRTAVAPAQASGTFKTLPLANNTGTLYPLSTAVVGQWYQGGRIGAAATSVMYLSGSVAADGTVTFTGLPTGSGYLLAAVQGASVALDKPYYQPGTVT